MSARNVAPPAPTTTYSTVFANQRTKTPLLYSRAARIFSHNAKSPENQRPKLLSREPWVFVALINNQIRGINEYTRTMPVKAVRSRFLRGFATVEPRRDRNFGYLGLRVLVAVAIVTHPSENQKAVRRTQLPS